MTAGIGIDKASELTPRDFDRLLLRTLTAVKKGDFRVRMPVEFTGASGKIADTLNEIIELNERLSGEIERIATVVGSSPKPRRSAAFTATTHSSISAPTFTMKLEASVEARERRDRGHEERVER